MFFNAKGSLHLSEFLPWILFIGRFLAVFVATKPVFFLMRHWETSLSALSWQKHDILTKNNLISKHQPTVTTTSNCEFNLKKQRNWTINKYPCTTCANMYSGSWLISKDKRTKGRDWGKYKYEKSLVSSEVIQGLSSHTHLTNTVHIC